MTRQQLPLTGQAPVFEVRSAFYCTPAERVNKRLKGANRRGDARAHSKAVLLLAAYAANLVAIVLAPYPAVQIPLFDTGGYPRGGWFQYLSRFASWLVCRE